MKNVVLMFLGSLIVLPVMAQDTSPSPWTAGMSARYRFEDNFYSDLTNRKQFSHLRVRPVFTYDAGNGSKVVLEAQYTKVQGATAFIPSSATGNTSTETSGNSGYAGMLDSLWMRQAYIDLQLSSASNLMLGRQILSYGDQRILGVSDWGVYGRAFDAIRYRWKSETLTVDVFQAQIDEATAVNFNTNNGDEQLYGIYLTQKFEGSFELLDLYYIFKQDQRPANAETFGSYGARFESDFSGISWDFEYAQNFGADNTGYIAVDEANNNSMLHTIVGKKFGNADISLEYFMGAKNWREMNPTTHTVLGRNDVVGRRNLSGFAFVHKMKMGDKWSTDARFYSFQRTDADTAAYATNGTTTRGSAAVDSKDLGTELDVVVKYKLNKETTLAASMSMFQYGAYFKDSGVDENKKPLYSFFMVETKF